MARSCSAASFRLSGGCSPNPCERYGFGLVQYGPDGTIDIGFGAEGRVHPGFVTSSGAYGAVLLADGTVALAGHLGNEDFGLAFVDPEGDLIPVEGGDVLRIDFSGGSDRAVGVALGPGGTIVLSGDAATADGAFDFGLARYQVPDRP